MESDDKEGDNNGTVTGIQGNMSLCVTALLEHKANAGVKARQMNDIWMPKNWYATAICGLKSQPGFAHLDFKRCDIENKVRSIISAEQKRAA